MRILSLDTSSPACTVAIVDCDPSGAAVLSEINVQAPRGHMARLLPQIETTLREAGMSKEELDGISVGIGPGSFTGLRIGLTIARTLAQLLEVPIVGVPSPDAIAHSLSAFSGTICPVIDAKRQEVYAALYESSAGSVERITDFRPIAPEALAYELIDAGVENVIFAGDGVGVFRQIFADHLEARATFASTDFWWPRAANLGIIACSKLIKGLADDLFSLVPIYARLSQAEEMWIKRGTRAK